MIRESIEIHNESAVSKNNQVYTIGRKSKLHDWVTFIRLRVFVVLLVREPLCKATPYLKKNPEKGLQILQTRVNLGPDPWYNFFLPCIGFLPLQEK